MITAAILLVTVLPFAVSAAGTSKEKVRVGYYENEVFQEGAKEGSVKTGYAYEYYLCVSKKRPDLLAELNTAQSEIAVNENNRMQYYFVLKYYPDAKITFYPSIDACLKAVSDGDVGYCLCGFRC